MAATSFTAASTGLSASQIAATAACASGEPAPASAPAPGPKRKEERAVSPVSCEATEHVSTCSSPPGRAVAEASPLASPLPPALAIALDACAAALRAASCAAAAAAAAACAACAAPIVGSKRLRNSAQRACICSERGCELDGSRKVRGRFGEGSGKVRGRGGPARREGVSSTARATPVSSAEPRRSPWACRHRRPAPPPSRRWPARPCRPWRPRGHVHSPLPGPARTRAAPRPTAPGAPARIP